MAKKFELGETLAEVLKVSGPDAASEQIVLLPIASIDADENNFYSMDGVEELAANIELIGLLDPLRVRENPDMPGRYLIVSGHRRRAALWTLFEEAPEKWGKVPCIVEQPAASPELQELRLIYANADTRKMSSADQAKQAERVEMLLYKLKDQGMEFPGRMRDHVAEACKVSTTKLAELKVIRKKLIPELRQLWESGELNHTVAYRLAQAEEHAQTRLTELYTAPQITAIPEWQITDKINALHGLSLFCCPDGSGPCGNISSREEQDLLHHNNCHAHCCMDCYWLRTCGGSCKKAEAKKQQLVEEAKARNEEIAAVRKRAAEERETEAQAIITEGMENWKRIAVAARAAGVSSRTLAAVLEGENPEDVEDDIVTEVEQRMDGSFRLAPGVKPWQTKTYNNPMDACDEPQILIDLADLLKCSTDYLLGRTEFLTPPAAPQQADAGTLQFRSRTPEWISPENMLPADGVKVLILDENGDVDIDWRHDGDWFFTKKESVMFWAPIPPVPDEDVAEYYIEPGEPAAAPQQADAGTLQFRSGTPDHDCVCWAIFQVDDLTSVHQARWKDGGWWLYNIEATIDAECVGWIELPDYEGVLRK